VNNQRDMTFISVTHCKFSVTCDLTLLAGWGGWQPPIGAPGAISQAIASYAERGGS
jgi:hypothetical protein